MKSDILLDAATRFVRSSLRALVATACLTASLGATAKPVTREQAMQKATTFLQTRRGSHRLTPVTNSRKLAPGRAGSTSSTALYYVFNRGDQEGYIIMPGDDMIEPVLGYTDAGEFDYQSIPDNMRAWLDGYADYIDYLQKTPNAVRAKVPVHPSIGQMLTCTWNQSAPYNDECPMYFTLGRSVTGCVATAMAQILYYERAKSVTETQADMPSYTTWTSHATYGQLHVDGIPAGSPIDWDNMLDSYGGSATAKQRLAVAQLMHYCGVAVEMDYTNSSSGAQSYKVADAMNTYFGYSTARYISRSSYSDEGWDAVIYSELEQGRVVYLSGANSEAGHAFVCDGYDGNHCYHINWGWGGQSNGYFLLSSLNPSSQGIGGSGDGYNQYQDAVIGCEPDNYGEKEMPIANATVKRLCVENWDTDGDGKFSFGEAAAVTDLGTVFRSQRIAAFNELYNFTGLTSIADSAFYGCSALTTIKLPKALKHIGEHAFDGCRALKTLKLPDHLCTIGRAAFASCRVLPNQTIPAGITTLADSVFAGCQAFTAIELPLVTTHIGSHAFAGCTKLTTVSVSSVAPQDITLGTDVFGNIDLAKATLNVVQGTRSFFTSVEQWRDFGTIYEVRTLSRGQFAELAANKTFYIYNEGTGRYLTKGEAWGTQAVVGTDPMRFQLRHTATMPDGVYYLYSDDTGASGHILFRTNTDGNVGQGVQACFVDGGQSHVTDKTAWWNIQAVGSALYTIQIPSGQSNYAADRFLGVQTDHASNAATPTYGAYSDVAYDELQPNCQWRFVEYDESAQDIYNASAALANLLAMAKTYRADYAFEQAVYDDMNSTVEQLTAAQRTLRKKLSLINFRDPELRDMAVSYYDVNGDGEISYSEASKVTDFGYNVFTGRPFTDLTDLQYFPNATALYGNSFENCTTLQRIILPAKLEFIYYRIFKGCTSLTEISLPASVTYLGDNTFDGCTALTKVTVLNPDPATIQLGNELFKDVNLSAATLCVPHGSRQLYAEAEVWKEFGQIVEVRGNTQVPFSPIEPNVDGYIYNIAEHKYLNQGEAWGTQAVVAKEGFVYQFRRSNSLPEGVYYLYSANAGGSHVLFRTANDAKVGTGVKACFVDGSMGASAYWQIVQDADDLTFTMQVPSTDASYTEGQYLGTQLDHESEASPYGTNGAYWDVEPGTNPAAVQWAFIKQSDVLAAEAFDQLVATLRQLLATAAEQDIEHAAEQAVYDNFDSNADEIEAAIASLRHKLGYIDFADARVKTLCVNNWDADDDGELSYAEAAAVADLGTTFRSQTAIHSFEELRYFTSLTSLSDEAFNGCTQLLSLYLPAGVGSVGTKAFTSCSALKYIAVLSPSLVGAEGAAVPRTCTVFVPADLIEAYTADADWGRSTIAEYTGVPTVAATSASRAYARTNAKFAYTVSGAPINGEPELLLLGTEDPETGEAYTDATLPAGDYVIQPFAGTITSLGLQFVPGTLTVERVPLTITVKSCSRYMGEENPEFELTYKGFKNREKAETALSVLPTVECDATPESPAGDYEIRAYGAEARNYDISYEAGTLTVLVPVGIDGLRADGQRPAHIYDLQGRRVSRPQRGLYIIDGQKTLVR